MVKWETLANFAVGFSISTFNECQPSNTNVSFLFKSYHYSYEIQKLTQTTNKI